MTRELLHQILFELNEECIHWKREANLERYAEANQTRQEVRELLNLPAEGILADLAKKFPLET